MKKSILARGFVGSVASLLGVLAVGCGADVGPEGAAGDSAEIGSIAQAITGDSIDVSTTMVDQSTPTPVAQPRKFASSCQITSPNGSNKYMLVVGGLDPNDASGYSRAFQLFKPGTGWVDAGQFGANGDEVAEAAMIVDPSSASRCLLIGGDRSNAASPKIWELSVDNSDNVTVLQQGALNDARSNHEMVECHGKVLIIAGKDGNTRLDTLEVYDPASRNVSGQTGVVTTFFKNENGTPADVTLDTARSHFAIAKNGNQILVGGGRDASTIFSSVEGIKLDSANCRLDDASRTSLPLVTGSALSAVRSELVGFFSTSSSKFTFAAGLGASAASNVVDELTPTFTAGPNYTVSATRTTTTTPAAAARPTLIPLSSTRFVLWGGHNPGTANALSLVQELSGTTWTSTTIYDDNSTLTARLGATGVYFNNVGGVEKVYAVGGSNAAGTILATMDEANSNL